MVYLIFFAISWIYKRIFYRVNSPRFQFVRITIGFVGVAVHELSHLLGLLLVGVKPVGLKIRHYHGYVVPGKDYAFAQALIVCLAPLVVSLWLLDWALALFLTPTTSFLQGVLLLFFMVSLIVGAAPSHTDLRIIYRKFEEDLSKNLGVLSNICLSFALTAYIFWNYELFHLHDLIFFLTMMLIYLIAKLSWKAVIWVINLIRNGNITKKARYKPNYISPELDDEIEIREVPYERKITERI